MDSPPLDIITKGSWESALFTTYALSLSFFEAHLLRRGLKQNGCREIWVAADIDGYTQSLAERQALSVGQDYRLVPVGLRSGVFHPKCVYLQGAQGDALIVGSGNLTFGGYGRNVEVAEVFFSKSSPAIFSEFASFLRALKKRADLFCPDATWIDAFSARAERTGAGAVGGNTVRLAHCVEQAIDEQVANVIAGQKIEELRILSPYYDSDAAAVRRLKKRVTARRAMIGLLPKQEDRSAFPFSTQAAEVSAAVVKVDAPHRRLHAKWIELEMGDGRTVTLTGSVNATTQSLCTTNNIELGVLRVDNVPARLAWTKAKIPAQHIEHERKVAGIGERFMLHASILEIGIVRGIVLPAPKSQGDWRATLSQVNGDALIFTISVDATGVFTARLPKAEGFDYATGLQLLVERDGAAARSWMQNEWLLELARVRNVPTGSILRFLRGESAEEDDLAVLEFLSACLDDLPARQGTVSKGERAKTADDNVVVSVEALKPGQGDVVTVGDSVDRNESRITQLLRRLLKRFEFDLTEAPELHAAPELDADDGEDAESEDGDEPRESRRPIRFERAIDRFRGFVRERLQSSPGVGKARELSNVWFIVETLFRSRQPENDENLRSFLRHWLIETARSCRVSANGDPIDERMAAVAATLGAIAIDEKRETELVGLHEALENFGIVGPTSSVSCRERCLLSLPSPSAPDLNASMLRIFGAKTRRQEAKAVYDAALSRRPFGSDFALLKTADGRQLVALREAGSAPKLREFRIGSSACPGCYRPYSKQFQVGMERLRFARCEQCETFFFNFAL